MTSACIFKATLRENTQVFFISQSSIFQVSYELSTSNVTDDYFTSSIQYHTREHQRFSSFMRVVCCFLHFSNHSFKFISRYQNLPLYIIDFKFRCFKMMQDNSFNSTDSDIIYVEQSSTDLSPQRKITPKILNSTELSGALALEHITLSSVASPEPRLDTIHPDSNEPTLLMGMEDNTQ